MTAPTARFADLEDATVLVTGGGSGIGAALVEGFVRQGCKVAFLDIAEDASRGLVESLGTVGRHPVLYLPVDLRDVTALTSAIDTVAATLGPIRVLVNNAGWDDRHDLDTVSEAYWDNNQAVNLKHLFFAIQAAAPSMRKAGGGSIVNLSSIAFLLNMPDLPAYATAKAGIIGMTKSLAGRLGPEGIRVNAILPGMVVTERQKELWLTEDGMNAMLARQCLKQLLTADDMVGPCLFLASTCSGGITAQSIIVDGGVL